MKNKIFIITLVFVLTFIITISAEIRIYFSPDGGTLTAILEEINNATDYIDVAIYSFTSEEIARGLLEAQDRGIRVRILMDRTQAGGKYSQYTYLLDNGINIIYDRHAGIMHNKIILIDGKVLFTGSYNLTENAETKNEENLLMFIDDEEIEGEIEEEIIKIYQERLNYLWKLNQ